MFRFCMILAVLALIPLELNAEVRTETITYEYAGTKLKGHLAWDDSVTGKRPGILVVHEWWGLNDYARKRAEQLAKMGYVAFACDMYGEGKMTEHPTEAGQMAGQVRQNLETWMGRAQAALKVLKENEKVDGKKIAAIGYCFGGSTVLQLAFHGTDLSAVVSFHGSLPVPTADQAKAVKAKILICHGALDNFIPEETIVKVRKVLEEAKVDYQLCYYGGAVHSFTVPDAESKKIPGIAYQKQADTRSWADMKRLFDEVFK